METTPAFMTGVFPYSGTGLATPVAVAGAAYTVPGDKRTQLIYFRGGNAGGTMIAVTLLKDGKAMRTFPIGAQGAMHVPLAVVEDIMPDSRVTLAIAAPAGAAGEAVGAAAGGGDDGGPAVRGYAGYRAAGDLDEGDLVAGEGDEAFGEA